jgi:hypothetical protein
MVPEHRDPDYSRASREAIEKLNDAKKMRLLAQHHQNKCQG